MLFIWFKMSCKMLSCSPTENTIMTVRRYSISSNAIHVPCKSVSSHKYQSDSDWARLRGEVHGLGHTATEDRDKTEEKPVNRRTLQHCVNKARCDRWLLHKCSYLSCFKYNLVKSLSKSLNLIKCNTKLILKIVF